MYFPKRLLLLFRSVQALPKYKDNSDQREFPLELIFNTQQKAAVSSLAESFHDGVGVQHPPLDPVHRVLTPLHRGRGSHGGVIFHQATRRPRLFRDKQDSHALSQQ